MKKYINEIFIVLLIVGMIIMIFNNPFEKELIKKGEQELYNNIPKIMAYKSNVSLRDKITIKGRTSQQILGTGYFEFDDPVNEVGAYYISNFEKQGWKQFSKSPLYKGEVHYGDEFIYENGDYRIAFYIYPSLENKLDKFQTSIILGNRQPHYEIFIGKKNVIAGTKK